MQAVATFRTLVIYDAAGSAPPSSGRERHTSSVGASVLKIAVTVVAWVVEQDSCRV